MMQLHMLGHCLALGAAWNESAVSVKLNVEES